MSALDVNKLASTLFYYVYQITFEKVSKLLHIQISVAKNRPQTKNNMIDVQTAINLLFKLSKSIRKVAESGYLKC